MGLTSTARLSPSFRSAACYVNHLWRLLADLDIPYATLLDLDWGRDGGGMVIKTAWH